MSSGEGRAPQLGRADGLVVAQRSIRVVAGMLRDVSREVFPEWFVGSSRFAFEGTAKSIALVTSSHSERGKRHEGSHRRDQVVPKLVARHLQVAPFTHQPRPLNTSIAISSSTPLDLVPHRAAARGDRDGFEFPIALLGGGVETGGRSRPGSFHAVRVTEVPAEVARVSDVVPSYRVDHGGDCACRCGAEREGKVANGFDARGLARLALARRPSQLDQDGDPPGVRVHEEHLVRPRRPRSTRAAAGASPLHA